MDEKQEKQVGDSTADGSFSNWGGRRANQTGRPPGPATMPRIPSAVKERFAEQYKREMRAFAGEYFKAYKKAIQSGDSKIIIDAGNRLMGRPVTSVELSGPGGQPIRLQAAAAVALALSDPAQLSALAAFSRLVAPDGDQDDDGEDIAGELAEGEPVEVLEGASQAIISCPVEAESPQVSQPVEVSSLDADVADWLKSG